MGLAFCEPTDIVASPMSKPQHVAFVRNLRPVRFVGHANLTRM
jgi:hypothetical protein